MSAWNYDWNWNKERNKKHYCADEKKPIFKGLNIRCSDPGKLFALLSSLWDQRCPPIERKINKYLMSVTGAGMTFFMFLPLSETDLIINVVGDTELQEPFTLSVGSDFTRRLLKSKTALFTDDLTYIDPTLLSLLNKHLKMAINESCRNILVMPVQTQDSPLMSCFFGVANSSLRICGMDRNKTLIQECLRYCKGLVLNTYTSDMENFHGEMCRNVLKNTLLGFMNIDNEKALATVLQQQTAQIMNAHHSKVYFFKEAYDKGSAQVLELVRPNVKEPPTIVETVLKSYISTPEIIVNKDPKDAFQFTEILKKNFKPKIRTLMSFPTFYDGFANGHIDVINKKTRGGFNKTDEEYARCLGAFDGLIIEAMWKLRSQHKTNEKLEQVDCVLMRRAKIHCGGVQEVLYCGDLHSYDYLLEFRFQPYDVPEAHVICILMGIFDEIGFLKSLRIDETYLIRFLISVNRAHTCLPYHNWYHGFASAHFVFVMFYSLSLLKTGIFTDIEGFALLIAALTHDVDFRGCTTPFQVCAGDNLGALYSSAGGVQQRIGLTSVLWMITNEQCNILSKMDLDEFKTFVSVLQILFLDSNLAYNVDKMSDVYLMTYRKYDRNNTIDVRMLLSLCLTCACLSDYTKSWQYFMGAHDRQMLEYNRTDDHTYVSGVFDLEDVSFNSKIQVELQVNFMRCLVLPAFENLYIMFPTTYECHRRAEQNLLVLEELLESLQKFPDTSITDLYRIK
uniref:3',5'-cyclic-GMP phosphodiesterase n=1 Tax=Lygus hesperus TaxID=30085 RepID=A0A0A9WTX0_LYGHE